MTSCRVCSTAKVNLRVWFKRRSKWYRDVGEIKEGETKDGIRVEAVNPCKSCGGACHMDSPYRKMTTSVEHLLECILCPKIRQPQLEIPKINEHDMVVPGAGREFWHSPHACHRGCCDQCGLENKFPTVNGGAWDTSGSLRGRFCPVEWTDDEMKWYQWTTVPLKFNEKTQKMSTYDEFLLKRGTRKEFLVFMRKSLRDYAFHKLYMITFYQNWRVMEYHNMHVPALRNHGGFDHLPAPPKGTCAFAVIDFASTLDHVRPYTGTCQYPEHTHLCVLVLCHSPFIMKVEDIADDGHRKRMTKKGYKTRLMYKVAVFFAYTKARNSATMQANVMRDAVNILNEGQLRAGVRCEVFENGSRVKGGEASHRLPLREGLVDRTEATPYAVPRIEHLTDRSDQCPDQFMCAAAFSAVESFQKDTGVNRLSVRSPPGEGKHAADGYGGQPQRELKKHAVSNAAQMADTYGGGTREMVMFLATKLKRGAKATKFARGRWSVDSYFHMYYNETTGVDLSLGRPHETWKGSDNCTVFWNHATKGIGRRAMHCECGKCRIDEHWKCLSDKYDKGRYYGKVAFTNLVVLKIPGKRTDLRSCSTATVGNSTPLQNPETMILKLDTVKKPNQNWGPKSALRRVVAVRDAGVNGSGYDLVRPVKKPWKTTSRCTAAGVVCPKNSYLIEVQYYTHLPNERAETDPADRVYELKTGAGSTFILPLICLVHNMGNINFVATRRPVGADEDQLVFSAELHDELMRNGALVAD